MGVGTIRIRSVDIAVIGPIGVVKDYNHMRNRGDKRRRRDDRQKHMAGNTSSPSIPGASTFA